MPAPAPPGPHVPADAWAIGPAREARLPPDVRTAAGAWFTPREVARELAALADPPAPPRSVLDPACGGGAFLLAAAERWPGAALVGADLDVESATACRAALAMAGRTDGQIVHADGLLADLAPADLVLSNPPFLSQLRRDTARQHGRRQALRDRYGRAARRYVDEAAIFLLAIARDLLTPGGVAVVVVPEPLLAAADAAIVRNEVARLCTVDVVWRDRDGVFPGTPTCALRLQRRPRPSAGSTASWGSLLADGVPRVTLPEGGTLADVAAARADFRDAYYLLADHVHERDDRPGPVHPLVTVGLIDPANLRWGTSEVRFAKQRWRHPVVSGLPQEFRDARTGPKVMVATQTRVLEAVVDDVGDAVPSTPVITMRTALPWHVGAALTDPVATAVAARRHAGAARSRGALKLSARQLLDLPVPPARSGAWDEAAQAFRDAHAVGDAAARHRLLVRCGELMCAAHGVDGAELLPWWTARLPHR